MDAVVLLGSFIILILLRVPVAYSLGLATLVGAWWIDIPLHAVMIQIAGGVNKFSLLAIPFFVLAGAIMAEGDQAPESWSASSAVACHWSTSPPRPFSAPFQAPLSPTPPRSARC